MPRLEECGTTTGTDLKQTSARRRKVIPITDDEKPQSPDGKSESDDDTPSNQAQQTQDQTQAQQNQEQTQAQQNPGVKDPGANLTSILLPVQDPRPVLKECKQSMDRLHRDNKSYAPEILVDGNWKLPKVVSKEGLDRLEKAYTTDLDTYHQKVAQAAMDIRRCHRLSIETSHSRFRVCKYKEKLLNQVNNDKDELELQKKLDALKALGIKLAVEQRFEVPLDQAMETAEI